MLQTYNVEMCYIYTKKINCQIESKEEEKRFDLLHLGQSRLEVNLHSLSDTLKI